MVPWLRMTVPKLQMSGRLSYIQVSIYWQYKAGCEFKKKGSPDLEEPFPSKKQFFDLE